MSSRVAPLAGFRVGVTADRRAAELIKALERRGAEVLHGPAIRIVPREHDEPVVEQTREVIRARPDIVLLTTEYGVARWLEIADVAGLGAELVDVLDGAILLARGPKVVAAVRAAGLVEHRSTPEYDSTAAMVDHLLADGIGGRRVAIQLPGDGRDDGTDEGAVSRLRAAGEVIVVRPYRWVGPRSPDRLHRLIHAGCDRRLDALAFTSAPGVTATLAAARTIGRRSEFVAALADGVLPIAIGPLTAAPLRAAGLEPAVPDPHRLGAMIRLICDRLGGEQTLRFRSGVGSSLELRGRVVLVDDRPVTLAPHALELLRLLLINDRVVLRDELMRCLSDRPDDPAPDNHAADNHAPDNHALDVAMSRLRQSLGVPGLIVTVVRRGYRFAGVRVS